MQSQLAGVHNPPDMFQYADPRIENYFLMKSPLPVTLIMAFYTSFVFKIGPALMKNRPPMKLDRIIMVYNWVQIILNGVIFLMALRELPKLSIFCSPIDKSKHPDALAVLNLQYAYTMLKIFDLLDTIFFVLRKKHSQVTFLHVYHHTMMAVFSWITCKFFIGGQVFFLGLPNLFVHVVMYFYYFLTSWDPTYRNSVLKKYITQLQILQHCFIFTAFALPLFNTSCSYPKPLLSVFLTQAAIMIYLFTNFYIKAYLRPKKVN
ncbi:very long chain fatty acid elongase 7 isoform X1 [Tribolium castaneum]|uniref:very long chain fatty acid elongase 7 isoform X1 n=2 Tax=Tribolium castaneum TaxID=7070 RepID=UPI0030FEFC35